MLFITLFITFFMIGLFGFGGGYGMLSLIQTEVVRNHHWMTSSEFTNIVAISQMTEDLSASIQPLTAVIPLSSMPQATHCSVCLVR